MAKKSKKKVKSKARKAAPKKAVQLPEISKNEMYAYKLKLGNGQEIEVYSSKVGTHAAIARGSRAGAGDIAANKAEAEKLVAGMKAIAAFKDMTFEVVEVNSVEIIKQDGSREEVKPSLWKRILGLFGKKK
jgi:transcriptional regulator NrdR family protein